MIHFISDLHLSPKHPQVAAAFLRYIGGPARGIDALYILGDLFDAWPGDDALVDPAARGIAQALAALAGSGTKIYIMQGNRDFMLDRGFAEAAGATLIEEPYALSLGDTRYFLMHGDALCTDDVAYQQFRAMVRNPQWRAAVLAKTLEERLALAAEIRMKSEHAKQDKDIEIMDVNLGAVETAIRAAGQIDLIHGHTHRPACHTHVVDGKTCKRWVLHDWHDKAEWLEWTPEHGLAFRSC
ncbi:UDP-2,3-diacylglucosamine diphosphatase [Niveibacterium microcysteis]|uniref:UDP-2,3-diacylglucosamine hydrolase n=1 Tax=Niveibacterium microcysteis TaxID=2811415 RepID=A0ABX7M3X1_9RHOO|nr:UDP-2,3-diacylglucosamine diphosphatase [Niveibacterium microcysteis]QSI75409.1 UDP-2,3-diacylglucosamine diphosphatase [Niveibacterium microcysteis]